MRRRAVLVVTTWRRIYTSKAMSQCLTPDRRITWHALPRRQPFQAIGAHVAGPNHHKQKTGATGPIWAISGHQKALAIFIEQMQFIPQKQAKSPMF
jgi:hypothetical protein